MDVRVIPVYANILLWILHVATVVGAVVLPPTDVRFHCHNLRNTLSWGYDEPLDGVTFQVVVRSRRRQPVTLDVESPNMFKDLSEFSDPDNDWAVFVKAVQGSDKSAEVPEEGIEYSYFQDSPVPNICALDLPLVNVTTLDENHLHYSFTHPAVLYPSSQRRRRSQEPSDNLPVFDYHIDILNQSAHSLRNYCTESQCQGKVEVHGSQKSYCLNISGELRKISVRATKMYCSEPLEPAGISPLAYIIPIVLVVLGAGVVGYMIFVKRTRPSTTGPAALTFPVQSRRQQPSQATGVNLDYARVDVEPPSPEASSPEPLISQDQDAPNGNAFREEARFPLGVPDNDNDQNHNEDAMANDEPVREGAQGGTEDGYTLGNALADDEEEEEEEAPSGYEQRQNIV